MRCKESIGHKALGVGLPLRLHCLSLLGVFLFTVVAVLALTACASDTISAKDTDPIAGDWEGYMAIDANGKTAAVNHSSLAASFSMNKSCSIKVYDNEYPGEWSVSNTASTFLDKRMSNNGDILGYYEVNMDDKSGGSMIGILSKQDDGSLYLMLYRQDETTFVLVRKA